MLFENTGKEQRQLDIRFSLPVIYKKNASYWNGYSLFTELGGLVHNKRIGNGFPASCIIGEKSGLALGIEGHQFFSWLETGINTEEQKHFYWSLRMVLDPGQKDSVEFIAYPFRNDYGFLNAIDAYHKAFPDLFQPAPGIDPRSIYGNCASGYSAWGFAVDYDHTPQREMLRRSYSTWEWMYAPFKRSGDILGKQEYWEWGEKEADENGNFKGTAKEFREIKRPVQFNRAFKYNIVPMFYIANWVEEKLSKEVYPGTMITDPDTPNRIDPWVHTYLVSVRTYMWGNKFAETTKRDLASITKEPFQYLGGFAVDCAGGEARHRGEGMNQSPGTAYDEDGVFVSEGVGQGKLFDYIHTLKIDNRPMAIVSNGGTAHYMTAFRSDAFIDEKSAASYLTDMKASEIEQYLVGKKPRCIYQINYYHDKLGEQVDWQEMTPEQIREVYRMFYKSVVLLGLKLNMFYAADLAVGSKNIIRSMPAHIELSQTGWEIIPAADIAKEMWLSRYGSGTNTYIFVGNPSTDDKSGQASVDNHCLGDARYLFTTWEGKQTFNTIRGGRTLLDYAISPKEYTIYKCVLGIVAENDFTAVVAQNLTSDQSIVSVTLKGLSGKVAVSARIPRGMETSYVEVNGKAVRFTAMPEGINFALVPPRETTVEIKFQSRSIFSPETEFLDYPIFDVQQEPRCTIVLSSQPSASDLEIAWWIQHYFKVYCRYVEKFKLKIPIKQLPEISERRDIVLIGGDEIIQEVRGISPEASQLLQKNPGGALTIIGDNVLVVYAKDEIHRRILVDQLLQIWDKKYPYYGSLTLENIKGLGTEPQAKATIEMRKKAGVIGKVVDE